MTKILQTKPQYSSLCETDTVDLETAWANYFTAEGVCETIASPAQEFCTSRESYCGEWELDSTCEEWYQEQPEYCPEFLLMYMDESAADELEELCGADDFCSDFFGED